MKLKSTLAPRVAPASFGGCLREESQNATLKVRMSSALKSKAENLFRQYGITFADAVRLFARQSLSAGAMPVIVQLVPETGRSMRGAAHKYANPKLRAQEEGAWRRAAGRVHAYAH